MMRKLKGKLKGRNIEVKPIEGYRSDLYMHLYYQSDPASINQMDGNASAEDKSSIESLAQAMAMTIHFASTFHSAIDIIFPKPPKDPPYGIITALMMIPITWICLLPHLFIACGRILRHKSKNNKISKRLPKEKSQQALQQFCIKRIALHISRAQKSKIPTSKGVPKADDTTFHKNSASSRFQGFTTSFADVDVEKLNT